MTRPSGTRRPTETCVRGPDVAKLRYDGATYAGNRATGAGRNQKRHFHSVDELIVQGVYAWREKHQICPSTETSVKRRGPEGKKSLAQLFAESPFKGLSMNFERFSDTQPAG